jgi:hypothetical protein
MINWKGYRKKRSWANLRYHLFICLDRLKKKHENFNQVNRTPDRDLNPGRSQYIKIIIKQIGYDDVDRIRPSHNTVQLLGIVNTAMNFRVTLQPIDLLLSFTFFSISPLVINVPFDPLKLKSVIK